eukprot:6074464-Pyramimonas_sp.AAC.1
MATMALRCEGGTLKSLGSVNTPREIHVAPERKSAFQRHQRSCCVRIRPCSSGRAKFTAGTPQSSRNARQRTSNSIATLASLGNGETDQNKSTSSDASTTFDVVILSNGPGEVAGWVKPAVRALRN